MKATRSPYAPDTFTVSDDDGTRYTVEGGRILAHRHQRGRVRFVAVEPAANPPLVASIMAAIKAAPPAAQPIQFRLEDCA